MNVPHQECFAFMSMGNGSGGWKQGVGGWLLSVMRISLHFKGLDNCIE